MSPSTKQNRVAGRSSYATMVSKGLATTIHDIQAAKSTKMPLYREIIVNSRDPSTITSLVPSRGQPVSYNNSRQ